MVAVCDLYDGRLTAAQEVAQKQLATTKDYRAVLDRKDVDFVIVATPDHWHAKIVEDACAAGKDVYCEKPMSHTVEEGFAMAAAAEKYNRIVNLDAAQGFAAVAPVQPGQTGPYTGSFTNSLMNPDRNNFAPRVGVAWKPLKNTVVRSGYGISYNTGAYSTIVQQLAYQPPFATTETNIADLSNPLSLQNAFAAAVAGSITNNFGADRSYVLPYVLCQVVTCGRSPPASLRKLCISGLTEAGYKRHAAAFCSRPL